VEVDGPGGGFHDQAGKQPGWGGTQGGRGGTGGMPLGLRHRPSSTGDAQQVTAGASGVTEA
jgi:hypothetical protein